MGRGAQGTVGEEESAVAGVVQNGVKGEYVRVRHLERAKHRAPRGRVSQSKLPNRGRVVDCSAAGWGLGEGGQGGVQGRELRQEGKGEAGDPAEGPEDEA